MNNEIEKIKKDLEELLKVDKYDLKLIKSAIDIAYWAGKKEQADISVKIIQGNEIS